MRAQGEKCMSKGRGVDRRKFLTGAAIAGAATAVTDLAATTTQAAPPAPTPAPQAPSALRPSAKLAKAEMGTPEMPKHAAGGVHASDFMVDVIKSLDIDYIAANPAQSFRGLHESLITYGGNKKPELLTCMHEESSVAMAHGYFKIAGKPMLVMCHGTVGLQHASMAIYNAWCDRVPVIIIGGNDLDATKRAPMVPTYHSAQDINALVREFTKWDDTPMSPAHFAESFVRAYKIAMTPPHEPVLLALDTDMQEEALPNRPPVPRYVRTAPPQGDANAVREAAKLLVDAEHPVIVADRAARTPAGIPLLVQLAELLNVPVIDIRSRLNFPTTHYLHQSGARRALLRQSDVVLGLELSDFYGTVNTYIDNGENRREAVTKPGTKLISIGSGDYYLKSNYQDFQRFQPVDLSIAGDAEATLPALIEAVKFALPASKKAALEKRGEEMRKAWSETRKRTLQAAS
jgi:thiamine pyrophosphate-dependent acetolactate synthase large subunit-like protein